MKCIASMKQKMLKNKNGKKNEWKKHICKNKNKNKNELNPTRSNAYTLNQETTKG
jgi:hypothetical protein